MCTAELLSGLRSIEWDLQDLDDTVSIVEGNRQKYGLEDTDVQERKEFIAKTRKQMVALRDEVQGQSMAASTPGFSTAKSGPKMPSIGKSKGYGKVGSMDDTVEMMAASEDVERGGGSDEILGGGDDEILGAEPDRRDSRDATPERGRHRVKKCCLGVCVLLLLLAGGAFAFLHYSGRAGAVEAAVSGRLHTANTAATAATSTTATTATAATAAAAASEPGTSTSTPSPSPAARRRQLMQAMEGATHAAPTGAQVRISMPSPLLRLRRGIAAVGWLCRDFLAWLRAYLGGGPSLCVLGRANLRINHLISLSPLGFGSCLSLSLLGFGS